jgi:hypothetical protein
MHVSRWVLETCARDLLLVVQEVVSHIVERVAEYTTTVGSGCRIPVPEDDCVSELPERRSEDNEKCGRHDQSVLVHRKVVVDAMKEEM